MTDKLKTEGIYTYAEAGEGPTIIVLHGLMGALSNFDETFNHFSNNGYRVLIPELPLYSLPLIKTNVKNLAIFLKEFLEYKKIDNAILLGNSLGGHIALYFTKHYPEKVSTLILTGSSGLYEKAMGDSFPKRGNYEYMEQKTREAFNYRGRTPVWLPMCIVTRKGTNFLIVFPFLIQQKTKETLIYKGRGPVDTVALGLGWVMYCIPERYNFRDSFPLLNEIKNKQNIEL